MERLVSQGLWKQVKLAARDAGTRKAAIAYVTDDSHLKFGSGDTLIVDASHGAISSGQTDAKLLARALKRGARVYSHEGLHAKVIVLGSTAIVGSANMSSSSEQGLTEAAILTDRPPVVAMATAFIEKLRHQSERLDELGIGRLLKIKVKRRVWRVGKRAVQRRGLNVPDHRTWLVGVYQMEEEEHPEERPLVESGMKLAEQRKRRASSDISWIRMTRRPTRFTREAKVGDSIIEIWRPTHKGRPESVYGHHPIILKQRERRCVRVFTEEPASIYRTKLTWAQFCRLAARAGIVGRLTKHSTRLIPAHVSEALASLWGRNA